MNSDILLHRERLSKPALQQKTTDDDDDDYDYDDDHDHDHDDHDDDHDHDDDDDDDYDDDGPRASVLISAIDMPGLVHSIVLNIPYSLLSFWTNSCGILLWFCGNW